MSEERLTLWRHLEGAHGCLFTSHDAGHLTDADLFRLHEKHHQEGVGHPLWSFDLLGGEGD